MFLYLLDFVAYYLYFLMMIFIVRIIFSESPDFGKASYNTKLANYYKIKGLEIRCSSNIHNWVYFYYFPDKGEYIDPSKTLERFLEEQGQDGRDQIDLVKKGKKYITIKINFDNNTTFEYGIHRLIGVPLDLEMNLLGIMCHLRGMRLK